MEASDYLKNPCEMSSLPFWKTNAITIPADMLILRDDIYSQRQINGGDELYFKMQHDLDHIPFCKLDPAFELVDCNIEDFSYHINECYRREHISAEELTVYKSHPVFDPSLWVSVAERGTRHIVATGIAELDTSISEGILEWIQVSPLFRRRGLGKFVVCELLKRMRKNAKFVTVSGRKKNNSNPYALYCSCGFEHPVFGMSSPDDAFDVAASSPAGLHLIKRCRGFFFSDPAVHPMPAGAGSPACPFYRCPSCAGCFLSVHFRRRADIPA